MSALATPRHAAALRGFPGAPSWAPAASLQRRRSDWSDFSAQPAEEIAQLERVQAIELQQRHLRCMHVSSVRSLTIGETTICALVSDALRERAFGGDHRAMAVWAWSQRDPPWRCWSPKRRTPR